MSSQSDAWIPRTSLDQLREARDILRLESQALAELAKRLDMSFCAAVQLLRDCEGTVIVTGMGKAGIVGQKVTATLSSTGTRARFLHPAEAVHGDLGCVHPRDVVLALSNSGETDEIRRLIPILKQFGLPLIAVTAKDSSTLGAAADVTITLGHLREAGHVGLAPSTSTTVMLGLGDALALIVSRERGFTPQQFAVFHPAGSLGARSSSVRHHMRSGAHVRLAAMDRTVRDTLVNLRQPGRRTGAVMLLDDEGRLTGLFTDSDLARLLESRREAQLDRPVQEVMTADPVTIGPDAPLSDAIDLLSRYRISELPVVDEEGRPVGLIDITDIISLMPEERPD